VAKDWKRLLLHKIDSDGDVKAGLRANAANAITIFAHDPRWTGVLAYDEFAEMVITRSPPPWRPQDAAADQVRPGEWCDGDTTRLQAWLSDAYAIDVSVNDVLQAVVVAAERTRLHPTREYLRSLKWDGKQRLPSMLSTYFGAADTEYTRAIGMRWVISAVARVMSPGCQVDCTLILEGPQGIGKTSGFRALVPQPSWYSDTGITPGDKDSYQNLHGVWIYGLDELDSLKRGELTKTKNFLTATRDRYRPSYGRCARSFARQNVFCGTTNESVYLTDGTGNRRYWPVRVVHAIDPLAVARDRDQLWAEALVRYEGRESWHVNTPELRALCEAEQAERVQADAWTSIVAAWLAEPIAFEWEEDERTGRQTKRRYPYDMRTGVLTVDVLRYALEKPAAQITKADEMRAADVLKSLGYEAGKRVTENGARVRRYKPPGQPGQPSDSNGCPDEAP
jgi:predicted P-loop ATPase